MGQKIRRQFVLPIVFPLIAIGLTAFCIISIGQFLLWLHEGEGKEYERLELWAGTGLVLLILAVAAFLVSRPADSLGGFDKEVAIGHRAMLAPPLPPVDEAARRGPQGSVQDLAPGFVLYARNGALAKVVDVLGNVQESYGHLRKGLIYAQGVHGADDELWIPLEAVSAVYPESQSAFLAIAGDETWALGWNKPPAAFARQPVKEVPKLY